MLPKCPRVILIADQAPTPVDGVNTLLGRSDMRFIITRIQDAAANLQDDPATAAIILGTPHCFNGQQKDLMRFLDALSASHTGGIILTFSERDFATAQRLATDGLMVLPHTTSADELLGRIAAISEFKPVIDALAQENALLRRFDTGMNSQLAQIDEEMRLAARLQNDFLPRKLPEIDGCVFDILFRPASYVSGDIYDAVRLDEQHVGFYIADAVGHGMPAALLTIFIKRTLKTKEISDAVYRIVPPHEALAHLNQEMLSQQLSYCQFATMAYCIVNTKTLELQYARAGHPPPLRLSRSGNVQELSAEGPLLGVFPDEKFQLERVQLATGDKILLYSDGFESAFADASGPINDRYQAEFAQLAGPRGRTRFTTMLKQLDQQEGSLHPRDDVTAVMFSARE